MRNRIYVHRKGIRVGQVREVRARAQKVLEALKIGDCALDVFLCDRKSIRTLNRIYRGRDKMTSVLSFSEPKDVPHPELRRDEKYLGEVYLAPRYIKEHGEDATYLLTHGILHLAGYTHSDRRGRIAMEKKEREIMAELFGLWRI